MKFFFVNANEDIVFSVDTDTGQLMAVTNGAALSAYTVFGGLVYVDSPAVGESEIWCRSFKSPGDTNSVGFRIPANSLNAGAANEVRDNTNDWSTVSGAYPYFSPEYNDGYYDPVNDVVWMPWVHNVVFQSEAYLWAAFDPAASGTPLDLKGNAWREPDGTLIYNPYTFNDFTHGNVCWVENGWGYTGFDVNEGKCRIELATGQIQGAESSGNGPSQWLNWNITGRCSAGVVVAHYDAWSGTPDPYAGYVSVWADSEFPYADMTVVMSPPPAIANGDTPTYRWPLFGDGVSAPAYKSTSVTNIQYVGAQRVVGDDMYYTSHGDGSTIAFTIWKIALLTGTITRVYDVPYTVFNADGTIGDPSGSYYDDINNLPHSMLVVLPTEPPTPWIVGQAGPTRNVFYNSSQ